MELHVELTEEIPCLSLRMTLVARGKEFLSSAPIMLDEKLDRESLKSVFSTLAESVLEDTVKNGNLSSRGFSQAKLTLEWLAFFKKRELFWNPSGPGSRMM